MASNESKTSAELYREQRKARLAKAAKKNKSGKGGRAMQLIVKIICIVLVVGIVLLGVANLLTKVFCVPQRMLTAATYTDGESKQEYKLTVAEYNYYYSSVFMNLLSQMQQYDQYYGSGYGKAIFGFDASLPASEQDYTGKDAPEGVSTWQDYFKFAAAQKGISSAIIYDKAVADKDFDMDATLAEHQSEIDDAVKSYADEAKQAQFALDNYLNKRVGEGVTEKLLRDMLKKEIISQYYVQWFQTHSSDALTAEEVDAYYDAHREDFDVVTARLFSISFTAEDAEKADETEEPAEETAEETATDVVTQAAAEATAKEFVGKITNEASFASLAREYAPAEQKSNYADDSATLLNNASKSTVSSNLPALADWLFADGRAAGDKTTITDADNSRVYVAYVVSPASKIMTTAGADVRHILIEAKTTETDTEGNETPLDDATIEKNFAEAKKQAEELLAEWKKGDATEESFAALASDKTADSASAEKGGLYEDINASSSYVPEFLNWALASHKKGDTGIIRTSYGYHIMYFVGADEMAQWESDVRSTIATDKTNTYTTEITDAVQKGMSLKTNVVNYFVKNDEKLAENIRLNYQANTSSAGSTATIGG